MGRTADRGSRSSWPHQLPGASLVLVLTVALPGCASFPHHDVPPPDRLGGVSAVEVEVLPAAAQVRRASGAESGAAPPVGAMPRIQVSLAGGQALTEALIDAGSCGTGFPFRKPTAGQDWRRTARLTVELESVTLATGDGPDPLTALWVGVRTRLQLPDHGRELGSALHVGADPRPRPLSEWLAADGARMREAVSTVAAALAPRLVGDLGGGQPAKPCDWNLEVAAGPGGGDRPGPDPGAGSASLLDLAPLLPGEVPPAPVFTDVASQQPSSATGLKVLAALGGGVAGVFVGAVYGLGTCAKAVGGGGAIGLVLFVACGVVAVPVGAVAGGVVGITRGAGYVEEQDATVVAAAARANERLAGQLAAAVPPAWMAGVLARADRALAGGAGAGGTTRITVGVVRLIEERGDLPMARLEMEAVIEPAGGQPGPGRRVCLRGPGPVPTELWFRDEAALLLGSIEGNVARGVERGASGLSPQPGDGPCAGKAAPPAVDRPAWQQDA